MDTGWVLATFIAGQVVILLGSVFTPWLKDSLERKHQRREANRTSIAACLLRISAAAPEIALAQLRIKQSGPVPTKESLEFSRIHLAKNYEAFEAVFELGLLLAKRDEPIEDMARSMINAADKEDFAVEVSCFNLFAARWYRGNLSAKDARGQFKAKVDELRPMRLGLEPLEETHSDEAIGAGAP